MPTSQLLHESHVWFVVPESIRTRSKLDYFQSILSAQERERWQRLHFDEDRHRYLISHAMVRELLSRYADMHPAEWQFETQAHGKPEIANVIDHPLRFNLTHTTGLAACIVHLDDDCGIDAERISATRNPQGIARRMFSADEQDRLLQLAGRQQLEYFFERWTLREAYVKARGTGISFPMRKLCFDIAPEKGIRIHFQPDINDCPSDWYFRLLRPTEQHILAVALHTGPNPAPGLVVREYFS